MRWSNRCGIVFCFRCVLLLVRFKFWVGGDGVGWGEVGD